MGAQGPARKQQWMVGEREAAYSVPEVGKGGAAGSVVIMCQ